MPRLFLMVVTAIVLLLTAGVVVLAVWDVPAPSQPIDHPIPDSRFQK